MDLGDTPDLGVLDLDLGSDEHLGLLRAAPLGDGAARAALIARLRRAFLLRSPWAPGLRFVGAEIATAGGADSAGGAGLSVEPAAASCLGEAAEYLASYESAGRAIEVVPRAALASTAPPEIARWIDDHAPAGDAIDMVAGRDLATGAAALLPADLCLRRPAARRALAPAAPLSVGCAAGPDHDAATARALLELVERDAAALWWIGGRRGRPLALEDAAGGRASEVLAGLRAGAGARATWLLDIAGDLDVPCVAALSVGPDGRGLACGLAARLSTADAAAAAVLEMCQVELGILLAGMRRRALGEDRLGASDRHHLRRARDIDAATCELLHPLGAPRPAAAADGADALAALRTRLAARGIAAWSLDLTMPSVGVPVVRAVAPALQAFPSTRIGPRLAAAIAATGGGGRHTGGVALI